MARFVLTFDYSDPELRAQARPRHLEHLRRLHAGGSVVMAGPWVEGTGAMIVYEAADAAAAQAMVDADPYAEAGVIASPVLREWNVVLPEG